MSGFAAAAPTVTPSTPPGAPSARPGAGRLPRRGDRDHDRSPAQLSSLFERSQQAGDRAAREALIEHFMPLARKLARRYERSSEPFEDLLQVAYVGLVNAVDRFDAGRGLSFASFAVPTILGELKRHFRDHSWAVHVPRGPQERALKVEQAQRKLTARTGRAPTVGEIAVYLELPQEQVLEAIQVSRAYDSLALDAPRPSADGDGESYADSIGGEDPRFELVEECATIADGLRQLPERERMVLHLRFAEDLSQTEIANRIGVSQMQVSRLLRRSLEQLRQSAGVSS